MAETTNADQGDPESAARDTRAAVAEAADDAKRLRDAQPGDRETHLDALADEAETASTMSDDEIARDPENAKRSLDSTLADLADASAEAAERDGADTRDSSADG